MLPLYGITDTGVQKNNTILLENTAHAYKWINSYVICEGCCSKKGLETYETLKWKLWKLDNL